MLVSPHVKNLLVRDLIGVKFNQETFGGVFDSLIGGILFFPSCVPDDAVLHPQQALEVSLRVPESTSIMHVNVEELAGTHDRRYSPIGSGIVSIVSAEELQTSTIEDLTE